MAWITENPEKAVLAVLVLLVVVYLGFAVNGHVAFNKERRALDEKLTATQGFLDNNSITPFSQDASKLSGRVIPDWAAPPKSSGFRPWTFYQQRTRRRAGG